ncbi:MAG: CAP domain-containing protein [Capsulimonadales bacterium]|nr:CAP domain-containing protein [Capsulimonadales bacterium]
MRRTRRIVTGILAVMLAISGETFVGANSKDSTDAVLRRVHRLILLTNRQRAAHGLAPLKRQENLVRAAFAHARDMAAFGYFAHSTPQAARGTEDYEEYARRHRYPGRAGQNLYRGEVGAERIVDAWMTSPDHRRNLLDPRYCEIGVGFARNREDGTTYCVQFLGVRPDYYGIVIENEAYRVTGRNVRLFLYGNDRMTRMRFSNDGETFSDWEPFRSERDWRIGAAEGAHKVVAEFSDTERIYRCSDSIVLLQPHDSSGGVRHVTEARPLPMRAISGNAPP